MASRLTYMLTLVTATVALTIPTALSLGLAVLTSPYPVANLSITYPGRPSNTSTSSLQVWPGVPILVHGDSSIKSSYIEILDYSEKYWIAAFDRTYFRKLQASLIKIWKSVPHTESLEPFRTYQASNGLVSFELDSIEEREQEITGQDIRSIVYCILFAEKSFRSPAEVLGVYVKGDVRMARFRMKFAVGGEVG